VLGGDGSQVFDSILVRANYRRLISNEFLGISEILDDKKTKKKSMGCSSSSQAQVSRYQNTAKAKVKAFQAVVSIENTSMCVFNFFLFHICWIFPLSASKFYCLIF
jgi:hypothetical protein